MLDKANPFNRSSLYVLHSAYTLCVFTVRLSRQFRGLSISLHGNDFDVLSRDFAHALIYLLLTVGPPLVLSARSDGKPFTKTRAKPRTRRERTACVNGFNPDALKDELHTEVESCSFFLFFCNA